MSFATQQEVFSGPLGVLSDLLDKKELEIKDIALSQIADEYLAYLDKHEVAAEELADFLLIASKLIYLKTRELLPFLRSDDEDEGIEKLEDQLRLYKQFAEAATEIEKRFNGPQYSFGQLKPRKMNHESEDEMVFSMPPNVNPESMIDSMHNLLKKLAPFFSLQETSIQRVKSVKERIEELEGAIQSRAKMGFRDVVKGAQSKGEVVVTFLALLELVRRQVVRATQSEAHDIMIEKV